MRGSSPSKSKLPTVPLLYTTVSNARAIVVVQAVLGAFSLLPLAVGDAHPDEVAEVLARLWGGDETLIVVSSDLSHYLPYARATTTDRATVERILHFATDLDPHEACGALPLPGPAPTRRAGSMPTERRASAHIDSGELDHSHEATTP